MAGIVRQLFIGCVSLALLLLCPLVCSSQHAIYHQKHCDCTSTSLSVDSSELRGRCTCPEYGMIPAYIRQNILDLELDYSQPVVLRPGNIQKFNRIRVLDISGMQFVKPGGFQGLETLDRLFLYDNYMRVLETNMFTYLESLTRLIVEGTTENKIYALENGTFCNLTILKRLNLKRNAITEIVEEHFRDLENLDILDLNNNRLTQIKADTFIHAPLLKEIHLSKNLITEIHRFAFIGLTRLAKLVLDGNRIKGMPQPKFLLGSLEFLTDSKFRRVAISLDDNPLRCDCHLNWISSWLDNSQICNGFCQTPSQFQYKPLHIVYKNSLSQCRPNNTIMTVGQGQQLKLTCPFAGASWVTPDDRRFQEHGDCEDPFCLTNSDSLVIWKTTPELSGNYTCLSSDGTKAFFYHVEVNESFTIAEWAGIAGAPSVFVFGILVMSVIIRIKQKCRQRNRGANPPPVNGVNVGDGDLLLPRQHEEDQERALEADHRRDLEAEQERAPGADHQIVDLQERAINPDISKDYNLKQNFNEIPSGIASE